MANSIGAPLDQFSLQTNSFPGATPVLGMQARDVGMPGFQVRSSNQLQPPGLEKNLTALLNVTVLPMECVALTVLEITSITSGVMSVITPAPPSFTSVVAFGCAIGG